MDFPARDTFTSDQEKIEKFNNLVKYEFTAKKYFDNVPFTNKIHLLPTDFLFIGVSYYILTNKEDYLNIGILSDYFVDSCRKYCKWKNKITPAEYFTKNYDTIIKEMNDSKLSITKYNVREFLYKKNLFCSSHNPCIIKYLIELFKAKDVLDFSAGWGDRLLGAMASKYIKSYTGVDPSSCLHPKYQEMIKLFRKYAPNPDIKVTMIQDGFENVTLTESYDLVYTSPPYFDYEIYNEETSQSINKQNTESKWYDNFLQPSVNKSIKALNNDGHIALYIGQEKGMTYTENIINYIRSKPEMYYVGNISYAYGHIKDFHPIFIFQKSVNKIPKYLYNPSLFIQKMRIYDKEYNIIRDDLLIAGTKLRAAVNYVAKNIDSNTKQIYLKDSSNNYDQLVIAYTLYLLKRSDITLILSKSNQNHKINKMIKYYHPNIQTYQNNKNTIDLESDEFYDMLYKKLNKHTKSLNIKRLWFTADTLNYVMMMSKLFPNTHLNVVKTREFSIKKTANITEYMSSFKPSQDIKIELPYRTNKSNDAKIWKFMKQDAQSDDYIWNSSGMDEIV